MKLDSLISGVYPINTGCNTVSFPVFLFTQWVKIKTHEILIFSNERLITPSGLSLVGQMLGKSSFIKKCNNMKVDGKRSQSQIKNGDILLSYIGLLCQGFGLKHKTEKGLLRCVIFAPYKLKTDINYATNRNCV